MLRYIGGSCLEQSFPLGTQRILRKMKTKKISSCFWRENDWRPKHLFLTQVIRCLCLLSRYHGYAIQKIVLVLIRALRVVDLWQFSLCNVSSVLDEEILIAVDAGKKKQQQQRRQQQRRQQQHSSRDPACHPLGCGFEPHSWQVL